jgi:hypothetical protein
MSREGLPEVQPHLDHFSRASQTLPYARAGQAAALQANMILLKAAAGARGRQSGRGESSSCSRPE